MRPNHRKLLHRPAIAALGLTVLAAGGGGLPAATVAKESHAHSAVEPPQCTAIVAPGQKEGAREAWVYRTRFGRLALDAIMHGAAVVDYRFTLNGKPLEAATTPLPKAVRACLRAKGVVPPVGEAQHACPGERFEVLIARPLRDRFLILYVKEPGGIWRFCRASTVP